MIPYTAETTANVPASGYSTDGSMSAASLFGGAGGDGGASGGDGGCGGAGARACRFDNLFTCESAGRQV